MNLYTREDFSEPFIQRRLASIEDLLTQEDNNGDFDDTESEDFDEIENYELLALYTDSCLYTQSPKIKVEPTL